jgi:hypothetical protein
MCTSVNNDITINFLSEFRLIGDKEYSIICDATLIFGQIFLL